MIDEHDATLQRVFDERLLGVLPPPRVPRRRSASRVVAAGLAVLVSAGGFAFAADVNGTADAAGLSCAERGRSGSNEPHRDGKYFPEGH